MMKRLSKEQVFVNNAFFSKGYFKNVSVSFGDFSIRFSKDVYLSFPCIVCPVELGDFELLFFFQHNVLEVMEDYLGVPVDADLLDSELSLALAECFSCELLSALFVSFDGGFRLKQVYFADEIGSVSGNVGLCLFSSDRVYGGALAWRGEEFGFVSRFLESCMEVDEVKLLNVPLVASVAVGKTLFSFSELLGLEVGDIILVDELYGDRALLDVSGIFLWEASFEEGRLVVEKELEVTEVGESEAKELSKVEEVPVKVVFELGRIELTLKQLSEIKPGYVFELGRSLEHPVDIVANGKVVGRGELLEIDGKVGVRVKELG